MNTLCSVFIKNDNFSTCAFSELYFRAARGKKEVDRQIMDSHTDNPEEIMKTVKMEYMQSGLLGFFLFVMFCFPYFANIFDTKCVAFP